MMSRIVVASRERAPQESSVSPGRLILRWVLVFVSAALVGAAAKVVRSMVRMAVVRRLIVTV